MRIIRPMWWPTSSMVRGKSSEAAVQWLITTGAAGFGLLCLGAVVYERARKKIAHPELGSLTYEWGTWVGHRELAARLVRFELPGSRSGPDGQACQKLIELWSRLPQLVEKCRDSALLEFEDTLEDYEGGDLELIKAELEADPNNLLKHWKLYSVALSHKAPPWTLEFEVTWDPEHTRAALFTTDCGLVDYGLSCTVYDEDGE